MRKIIIILLLIYSGVCFGQKVPRQVQATLNIKGSVTIPKDSVTIAATKTQALFIDTVTNKVIRERITVLNTDTSHSATGLETYQNANSLLSTKVDKVTGKGLSTNDFTNTLLSEVNYSYPVSNIVFDSLRFNHSKTIANNYSVTSALTIVLSNLTKVSGSEYYIIFVGDGTHDLNLTACTNMGTLTFDHTLNTLNYYVFWYLYNGTSYTTYYKRYL